MPRVRFTWKELCKDMGELLVTLRKYPQAAGSYTTVKFLDEIIERYQGAVKGPNEKPNKKLNT